MIAAPVIDLEPIGWIARLRDAGAVGDMPDWRAAAEIVHLDAERCMIKALRGQVRRADLAALRERLVGIGYRVAFAQRAPGRRLPGWALIETGDLAGWWRWALDVGHRQRHAPAGTRMPMRGCPGTST